MIGPIVRFFDRGLLFTTEFLFRGAFSEGNGKKGSNFQTYRKPEFYKNMQRISCLNFKLRQPALFSAGYCFYQCDMVKFTRKKFT